jgi:hypothetical protein
MAGLGTAASTGRRVTTVPVGVCVTTVSTGSVVTVRLITVWALAPLAARATPRARVEAKVIGLAFMEGLLRYPLNVTHRSRFRVPGGSGVII